MDKSPLEALWSEAFAPHLIFLLPILSRTFGDRAASAVSSPRRRMLVHEQPSMTNFSTRNSMLRWPLMRSKKGRGTAVSFPKTEGGRSKGNYRSSGLQQQQQHCAIAKNVCSTLTEIILTNPPRTPERDSHLHCAAQT